MTKGKKIAIFDFDGTIIKQQSPDKYADFVAKNNLRNKFLQFLCNRIANHPKYSGIHHKKLKLYKIKGTPANELEELAAEFTDKFLLSDLIDGVAEILELHLSDPQTDVVIVSGGYDIYLRRFCELKGIKLLAATEIEIVNGYATGRIKGEDCYGNNKVGRLQAILDFSQYDLDSSFCYSDSKSDMPIFNLVGNKFFVSKTAQNTYNINKI